MGLIRSGHSPHHAMTDDQTLTEFLWPIVREMIKTAIENGQNLIAEGCYIPFDWAKDFEADELRQITYYCLIMSEDYIRQHFGDIKAHANAIEQRVDDTWCTLGSVLRDNARQLAQAKQAGANSRRLPSRNRLIKVMGRCWRGAFYCVLLSLNSQCLKAVFMTYP